MLEVRIDPMALDRLAGLLPDGRAELLAAQAGRARALLDGRVVWNVNATASGGGVAEMLATLLSYSRGAGVDARWLVLDADAAFFAITKRLHNLLHGSAGDGGPLGDDERAAYEAALAPNLESLLAQVSREDLVLLHDPQTAGLVPGLAEAGVRVLWRCHIGRDTPNELTDLGWKFLRPYVELADATVFSRQAYVPEWLALDGARIIPPSLDPFSAKNLRMVPVDVAATLHQAGLVSGPSPDGGRPDFGSRDGTRRPVRRHAGAFVAGGPVPHDVRVVLQVSRWDRLKDMAGVLDGFAGRLSRFPDDVHLVLAGPDVSGVSDDPEGAEVLAECLTQWHSLPAEAQRRVHLAALPMDDIDENAHLVNALQHHAAVVVQKSLVEGFGLTVTEPMWKGRPVVASQVGGIQDQIVDDVSGVLVPDPADLDAFAEALGALLSDEERAARLGTAAHERVRDQFLGDRHLIQYVQLFEELMAT